MQPFKTNSFSSRLCSLVFLIALLSPFVVVVPLRRMLTPLTEFATGQSRAFAPASARADPLNVITLIYGQSSEKLSVAHNCRMISPTKHRYIVFTDDMSQPYCDVCECRPFVKRNCKCPDSSESGCPKRNPCEKLLFLVDVLKEFKEIVFLDSDLVILKDYFLDRLQARSKAHDFLASYGHGIFRSTAYRRNFNSGLLFMRWLPGIRYDELEHVMYKVGANRDQGLISTFVQKYYDNWDVLSWKWHCRQLGRQNQDIPYEDCYTLHDRSEMPAILSHMNTSLLTIE